MTNSKPHIHISCLEMFPDIGIENARDELGANGLFLNIHRRPVEPYAALEWCIPTAFVVYIAKSYFDGFLKEAGKEHYILLKNWLKKTANNARGVLVNTFTASGSTDKLNENYSQSKTVSILIQTKGNNTIKLLFDNNLTKEDWENAIDQLFDYVIINYENAPSDKLPEIISSIQQDERFQIYALIDKETKQLIFHDDMTLIKMERDKDLLQKS